MLDLVELYTARKPGNVLAKYLPALRKRRRQPTRTTGWTRTSPRTGRAPPRDTAFQRAQDDERDRGLLQPGRQPGQGRRTAAPSASSSTTTRSSCTAPATTRSSFGGIRAAAMKQGQNPRAGRGREGIPQRVPGRARRGDEGRRRPTATPAGSTPRSGSSSTAATSTSTRRCAGRCTASHSKFLAKTGWH